MKRIVGNGAGKKIIKNVASKGRIKNTAPYKRRGWRWSSKQRRQATTKLSRHRRTGGQERILITSVRIVFAAEEAAKKVP